MSDATFRRRIAPLVRQRFDGRSSAERLLAALGVDPAFSEALLGDMAEERALRAARGGIWAARLWYLGEALRSVPHVAWSWVQYSRKHAPHRLVAVGGTLAVGAFIAALASSLRDGAPARFAGVRDGGFVVNSRRPVRLPMTVLDERGHVLHRVGLRYEWVSGVPATVSADGVMTCVAAGDAMVRVSAGAVATKVPVLCRPVGKIVPSEGEMSFVVGEPARAIGVSALDSTWRAVAPITGTLDIGDTGVALLLHGPEGYRVAPRAPGMTFVDIHIGDHGAGVAVQVYPRATTVEGMQNGERAAVAVGLANAEMRQWRLSPGRYYITMLPRGDDRRVPGLAILGANCVGAGDAPRFICVAGPNASVIAYNQARGGLADTVSGFVAVRRAE